MALFTGTIGDDSIWGSTSSDTIDGLGGNDTLLGDGGNDTLTGGDGEDVIFGHDGNDYLIGGAGDDWAMFGGSGNDTIDGGDGWDSVRYFYDPSGITLNLESGTATDGYGNTDTLISIEEVLGTDYNDRITGDGEDNWLMGLAGSDTLHGGGGNDTANYYWSTAGIHADLTTRIVQDGYGSTDFLTDIENINGSDHGNDTIVGNNTANDLDGNGGDDKLIGRGGKDYLEGGDGNDTLYGGSGNDFLFGGNGNDRMFGGSGNDWMDVSFGENLLDGGKGRDQLVFARDLRELDDETLVGEVNLKTGQAFIRGQSDNIQTLRNIEDVLGIRFEDEVYKSMQIDMAITGNGQKNKLVGGTGDDTISGGGNKDVLQGEAGADRLNGGGGNDRINGGKGNDKLFGGGGADDLKGGGGRDVLRGDKGDDTLDGGGGSDRFVFKRGDGSDTISNFNTAQDHIQIGRGASEFDDLTITQSGSDVEVTFANVSITLDGLDVADVTSDLFIF